jgi:hypothetical protein
MKYFDNLFPKKVPPGLYHYRATGEWQGLRLHLRVEADGDGVLIIDASRVLFLNGDTRSIMRQHLPTIKIFSLSSILLQRLAISVPFRTWELQKPSPSNNLCPRLIVWI